MVSLIPDSLFHFGGGNAAAQTPSESGALFDSIFSDIQSQISGFQSGLGSLGNEEGSSGLGDGLLSTTGLSGGLAGMLGANQFGLNGISQIGNQFMNALPDTILKAAESLAGELPVTQEEISAKTKQLFYIGIHSIQMIENSTNPVQKAMAELQFRRVNVVLVRFVEYGGNKDALHSLTEFWRQMDKSLAVFKHLHQELLDIAKSDILPMKECIKKEKEKNKEEITDEEAEALALERTEEIKEALLDEVEDVPSIFAEEIVAALGLTGTEPSPETDTTNIG